MSTDRRPSFYDPRFEHDACGVGFVAQVSGTPSHRIVQLGIQSVVNLTHRGAIDADGKSGDGAGILSQIPRKIVQRELARLGLGGSDPRDVAVGMFFLPRDAAANERARGISAEVFQRHGLRLLGWRPVPVDPDALGDKARATQPDIVQPLLARPAGQDDQAFERTLYLARKEIEAAATREALKDLYIPSLSQRTVVYKGLFVAPQLAAFYRDLADPDFESALVVFHQRYSTNTFPTWQLAQPFRALAHNGEINTLWGNRNWMRAREPELSSPLWGERIAALKPIVWEDGSDSASLDNALELLTLSGRDLCHAMMMLVPEAWENMPDMDADWRAFYMYHACLTEPWDGPAALAFTDGLVAAACLDRNGLRPARYKVTEDGLVIVASEVGTVDLPDQRVVEKGRLGPGEMIAVDTARGRLLRNDDLKALYAQRQPYCAWVTRHLVALDGHSSAGQPNGHASQDPRALTRLQQTFGYTNEDLKFVIEPMAATAKDAVWSMGDDAPPAVLSLKPKLLYSYFKQRFAQVTNPPIDPLREQLVMALDTYLGRRGSLLEETPAHGHLVQLRSPILTDAQLDALRSLSDPAFGARTLSALFPVAEGTAGLDAALERLCAAARAAIADGVSVLVVSDRGVTTDRAPLPLLLAVGALHHDLTRRGLRMRADIVVEGGEVWEVHHFATLIGYGASAVNPYLAHATARALASEQQHEPLDPDEAVERYNRAVEQALLKIMSKMGISTVTSYRGAQIFEAIGLDDDLVARHFTGTPSRINGIGLEAIAREALERHAAAYELPLDGKAKLPDFGFYRYRRDGEYHGFSPQVVRALQKAADSGSRDLYRAYVELLYSRKPAALRDLLRFRKVHLPVPLEEIEPAEVIVRRFNSQAMSLGALSPEAHKTIAIAMNRLGCRSNTGEGGEDPAWFHPLDTGDSANSKIKQVASGRFGVTPEYLARAEELEIKMAQGSKPGEGGQLPAHKVSHFIARLRHTIPGIPLISPPPHHDIYSIEDLAQLIYDLKQANPRAKVGVKLVAESGVGTIAAGVAKAYADYVLISGQDGGTGASPLSSIKNAGCPWEIGLAETQQVLVHNGLRGRVRVRVDGGFKTGRDVVVAALLGADEFGFGTATLVAMGCDMARQCHLNTCPTGIATQRPDLRAKFTGKPEQIMAFFLGVAQEVRELMAVLGFRRFDEMVGRVDLLEQVPPAEREHPKAQGLDLSGLLAPPDPTWRQPLRCVQPRNDRPDEPLDEIILRDVMPAIEGNGPVEVCYAIRNCHRTVGARVSGAIAHRYGDTGLPDGTVTIRFRGSAGQSFGAFLIRGMRLILEGEANDYVAKGMGGGEIVAMPTPEARFAAHENVIVGNVVLYGATGGSLFVNGRAGERFAVRNSGARAVVEGTGDHCCEYMTQGVVVVLGETGRNFGAGMSAGRAYVLDEGGVFPRRYNPELVKIERLGDGEGVAELRELVERHYELTSSARARDILADWDAYLPLFWRVVPHPPVVQPNVVPGHVAQRPVPLHGPPKV